MRATEFITELFQQGKNWQWEFRGSEEAFASFTVGDIEYLWRSQVMNERMPTTWYVSFQNRGETSRTKSFGLTGTGNSAEVMSTVVDITREFLKQYSDKVMELRFSAEEDSRTSLYARMVKRLLPNWNLHTKDVDRETNFYLTNPKAYVLGEDMSRRGFLGALGGMAAAAAGVDAEAGTKKPNIKSPSQQTIQQAKKLQATKTATPTKDPQAEAMLYRTAKASGMKGSELAQFLAQTKHESWDHSRLQEKPVGDPNRYFTKKYDPTLAPKTAKILGNKLRGDGAKYYGRGFIQLTGRDNYQRASEALGLDLINRPDLASKPEIAAKIAVWYWNTRVKPKVQNFDDTVAVTKTINNAMFGLEDRLANFIDYKKRVA